MTPVLPHSLSRMSCSESAPLPPLLLQDEAGMSALMKAADGGHREAVELLLKAGKCCMPPR